ncbi:4-diphosphocytidyl-2-C-methyl-D-erythritol kinase [Bathymodiolus japonicus methanotrophic gill symbiont]|uniref:4-(cytidine 5'-diphospho)-2-C-methyl-D-erythritol kinase n=1 Tax=Bathymodiolus japonicus methanotrophic gill symbiont TaxID=113269 RepID=UPI001B4B7D44|nr:4-(cytidine 5'-diphospho)-2-C-methyl-D-erythritol kinase [Bathymodiolus japonicus methanotrophic gill symbiont]GFO71658.1 4-diphosphocytidyl-2-C-methyl-D-erythritol kinase [Bathymodiolus japonicus methanotrophic gill symbiont]
MTAHIESELGWGVRWPAPAKLNLMLRVVGRREDGYHLLQTVFQIIDITDGLIFSKTGDGKVRLKQTIPGVKEEDDLTVRAANLLKRETGYQGGVCIEIEKNLPMGGGLGGGSSDAATVLVVLNQLWQLGITEQRLMELGLQLGADVPVFIKGTSTWAEGIGEKLTTIALPDAWFVIVKPDCHVDTGKIFSANDLTRDSKSITIADFNSGSDQNDCSSVVRKRYIEVDQALKELDKYGRARLTGTGACVFVQFSEQQSAQDVYAKLASDKEVYLAQGLAASPLHRQIGELFNF